MNKLITEAVAKAILNFEANCSEHKKCNTCKKVEKTLDLYDDFQPTKIREKECDCYCHYTVQVLTTKKGAGLRKECSHCQPTEIRDWEKEGCSLKFCIARREKALDILIKRKVEQAQSSLKQRIVDVIEKRRIKNIREGSEGVFDAGYLQALSDVLEEIEKYEHNRCDD